MIHVDESYRRDGLAKLWRVYADTHDELVALVREVAPKRPELEQRGEPNEHVVMTTTERDRILSAGFDMNVVSQRSIAALIRRKRREQAHEDAFAEALAATEADDFDEFESFEDSSEFIPVSERAFTSGQWAADADDGD